MSCRSSDLGTEAATVGEAAEKIRRTILNSRYSSSGNIYVIPAKLQWSIILQQRQRSSSPPLFAVIVVEREDIIIIKHKDLIVTPFHHRSQTASKTEPQINPSVSSKPILSKKMSGIRDMVDIGDDDNVYETDASLHQYLGLHFPSSTSVNGSLSPILEHAHAPLHGLRFPQRIAQWLVELSGVKEKAYLRSKPPLAPSMSDAPWAVVPLNSPSTFATWTHLISVLISFGQRSE